MTGEPQGDNQEGTSFVITDDKKEKLLYHIAMAIRTMLVQALIKFWY